MMKRFAGLALAIAAAALFVAGVSGEDASVLSKEVILDWDNAFTKEQLQSGMFANALTTNRIIRGKVLKRPVKAPYVGSLYAIDGDSWAFACTCVVVDTYIVMTAAHCVDSFPEIGICVSGATLEEGRCLRATRWKFPKKYEGSDFDPFNPFTHDVALVRTEKKLVQRGSKAKAITVDLDPSGLTQRESFGLAYGFGTNARSEVDGKLRVLDLEFKQWDLCDSDLDVIERRHFLCVDGNFDGSLGGPCFGDSGGPLVWSSDDSEDPDTHVLVGVSSFVYTKRSGRCDVRMPAGYTRIGSGSQSMWLKNTIGKLGGSFTLYEP